MSLSRLSLPSIALVLMSDHPPLPSHPAVIKFEFDPLRTIYPTSPTPGRVLSPSGVQIDSAAVQTERPNKVPVDETFFFCVASDSSTDVGHSEHGQLDDESDARTMFAEKRPNTSRGSRSKGVTGDVMLKGNFVASIIRSLVLQFKLKGSPMNEGGQVTKVVFDE